MKKNLTFLLKILVSAVLLFLIFRLVGVENVLSQLASAKISYLIIATLFMIPLIYFKTVRWMTIVEVFHKKIAYFPAQRYTLISLAFGGVTPARVGELIKAKYLKDKTGLHIVKSGLTIIIDKLFDLVAIFVLSFIGLAFFPVFVSSEHATLIVVVLLVLIIASFLHLGFFQKTIGQFFPKKYRKTVMELNVNRRIYGFSLFYSLIIWFIYSVQAYFVLLSINVDVSFFLVVVAVSLMALSSAIPISLGGIGVRDAVAVIFLSYFGVGASVAAAFSILYLLVTFGVSAIVGVGMYLQKKR